MSVEREGLVGLSAIHADLGHCRASGVLGLGCRRRIRAAILALFLDIRDAARLRSRLLDERKFYMGPRG